MNVSIIICTYNRADLLRVTLESLQHVRVPLGVAREVVVVDNNSTDGTRAAVESADPKLDAHYVFEGRQGKAIALNTGIARAQGDILVFTDDDVTMAHDWLEALLETFRTRECDGVGGRIRAVWSGPKPRWYSESGPYELLAGVVVRYEHGDAVKEVDMAPFGANLAFRREVFARVGGFSTELGPSGSRLTRGEDTEFCQRVRAGGGVILYAPHAIVYHPVFPNRVRKSYFQRWYYHYGAYDVRRDPPPEGAVRWFGVPRYYYRQLAVEAARWMTSLDPRGRFHHRVTCCRIVGAMVACRRRMAA